MRLNTAGRFVLGCLAFLSLGADLPPEVAELKAKAADTKLTLRTRASAVAEAATALDRYATDARDLDRQRGFWGEAISLVDAFAAENSTFEELSKLRFSSAVYRWAIGRSLLRQYDATGEEQAEARAAEQFQKSIATLEPIANEVKASPEPFAQNVRYRLAQVLADLADLDEDPGKRRPLREKAADLLATPITEVQLAGFAMLLRAEVGTDLGLHQQAMDSLEQASKLNPRPSPEALASVRVRILMHQSRFADGLKALAAEPIPAPSRDRLAIEILLGQLRQERGSERKEIEADIFARARRLRATSRADARKSLTLLARDLAEPEPGLPPDCWEILAEGFAMLGRPGRAAALLARGADRIERETNAATGDRLRYQAGAYHFQAGEFFEAGEILGRVLQSKANDDLKSKAGTLRVLSYGRALSQNDTRVTLATYQKALEEQIKQFPDLAVTQEAYWLLGRLQDSEGKAEAADRLLEKIRHGHPRWPAATGILANHQLNAIEAQLINGDRAKIDELIKAARDALAGRARVAVAGSEQLDVELLRARLELALDAGKPGEALDSLDSCLKMAGTPAQFDRTKQLRFLALARLNRWPEAEILARDLLPRTSLTDALSIADLLDRAGAAAESDLVRRRLGFLLRGWIQPYVEHVRDYSPADRAEVILRSARASLYVGDTVAARRSLTDLGDRAFEGSDRHLRDLADAFSRMSGYSYAGDIHRIRARKLKPGSLAWLDARLSLALAYYRGGQPNDAKQIIDATAILHPELGGNELKDRFERLRRRLEDEAKGVP